MRGEGDIMEFGEVAWPLMFLFGAVARAGASIVRVLAHYLQVFIFGASE